MSHPIPAAISQPPIVRHLALHHLAERGVAVDLEQLAAAQRYLAGADPAEIANLLREAPAEE